MIHSAEEFVALRTSDDLDEQMRASYEEAPEEVWLAVVARYPEMRRWVAHNKTVPHGLLRLLAEDPDSEVRWMVAEKRKLAPDLLDKLASDPDESVRQRVAVNAKTPRHILQRLAADPWEGVAEVARERLAKLGGGETPAG